MKIAVTYENGQIFQHFGHSENFKIYETEGKNIVSAKVIGTDGAGHSALAALLNDNGINVLICGGIGNGAVAALSEAGIEVYSGADGEADAARDVDTDDTDIDGIFRVRFSTLALH